MRWNFLKYFTPAFWTMQFNTQFRPVRTFFAKASKISMAVARSFAEDECALKASSLTFYSLLSIVPVLAVAFGIAKGFGFEKHLEAEITQKFLEQREVVDKLIDFAYSALKNAQSGLIAGVGLVVLFWSVLKLFGNIESSFNSIWKVKEARSWSRRFSDYLAMMLFCPIFFAASSSLSVFIVTQIVNISKERGVWETISPLVILAFHIFPLILAWLLFTALYYIMPNTKVPLKYAFLAGVIAGTCYQIVQWVYIQFQIGLSSYGAIYGSFAALPLFLVWLNTSWLITLLGAEIAHHAENEMSFSSLAYVPHQRKTDARVLGLMVMKQIVQPFIHGNPPPSIYHLAQKTNVAVVVMRHLIDELIDAGLVVEVYWRDDASTRYQPGRNPSAITIKAVSDALNTARHQYYWIVYDEEAQNCEKALEACDTLLDQSPINLPISELTEKSNEVQK